MKLSKTIKGWGIALATASMTFVTSATCDPFTGTFDFFRDDDSDDFFVEDFFFDDPFFFDDCFFDCF